MSKIIILLSIAVFTTAKPTNVGHGIVAAPVAVSYAPVTINSGVSHQSRVDLSTPIVSAVAHAPVVAAAPVLAPVVASPAVAVGGGIAAGATYGVAGVGGLGYGGGAGIVGYGIGGGHGLLSVGH